MLPHHMRRIMNETYYEKKRRDARRIYNASPSVRSPYFNAYVFLGPEGFEHLQRSSLGERKTDEQLRRFTLLPYAIRLIETATTVQEYRVAPSLRQRFGGNKAKPAVAVQWWGFVATFVENHVKIRVIIRKIGTGPLHLYSLMPYWRGNRNQRYFVRG